MARRAGKSVLSALSAAGSALGLSPASIGDGGASGGQGLKSSCAAECEVSWVDEEDSEWGLEAVDVSSRCAGPKSKRPPTEGDALRTRKRGPLKTFSAIMSAEDGQAGAGNVLAAGRYTLMMESVHENTWNTYAGDFKHWAKWRFTRGQPLWLEDTLSPKDKQDQMIDFYVYYSYTRNYAPATLWVWIYAVRFMHQLYEYDLDLIPMRRLKMSIKGWKRIYGAAHRKIPVTPELIGNVFDHGGLDMDRWDDLMVMLAITLAFSFLWRSCEYSSEGGRIDRDKCLRIEDGLFSKDNQDVNAPPGIDIDEFTCFHRTHKADFLHQGSSNNLYACEKKTPYCPIILLNRARRIKPNHFSVPENWLLACTDGKPVPKARVQKALKEGTMRLLPDVDPKHMSSHSLRAGGATTLWAMGKSEAYIMARGRWKSMCYKLYLWGARKAQRGLATMFWHTDVSLFAAVAAAAVA